MPNPDSPLVERLDWGRVHTSSGDFRDVKLWPDGGRAWDWNETGTHHSPGVQPADVAELLEHDLEILVIGRGQQERLQVTEEAIRLIHDHGVEAVILESRRAVERYNELAVAGVAVGALIHSTC